MAMFDFDQHIGKRENTCRTICCELDFFHRLHAGSTPLSLLCTCSKASLLRACCARLKHLVVEMCRRRPCQKLQPTTACELPLWLLAYPDAFAQKACVQEILNAFFSTMVLFSEAHAQLCEPFRADCHETSQPSWPTFTSTFFVPCR